MIKKCNYCNCEYNTRDKNRKFCSKSCSAIYNNKGRVVTETTKEKISKTIKSKSIPNNIDKDEFIKLYEKYKFIRPIAEILNISREKVREYFVLYGLPIKQRNKCISSHEKYCSRHDNTYTTSRCKKCVADNVSEHRRRLKRSAVEYKGGKCERCNYDKCIDALEFHHLDSKEKDFSISSKGNTRSFDKIKKEIDKCILLCSNCHREEHYKQRNNQ